MRTTIVWIAATISISMPAAAQPFEIRDGYQYIGVHERVVDPESCEGTDYAASHYIGDLSGANRWLSHRLRCVQQRSVTSAHLESSRPTSSLSAAMEGSCEIESQAPVAAGRLGADLMGWYEAVLFTTGWRRFHLVGHVDLQAEVLSGGDEWDGGFATISIERGRLGGPDEIIFSEALSIDQPGARAIDTVLVIPPGEFTVFMGMEQFAVDQISAQRNGLERVAAQLAFELRVVPCATDIDWDNRVDMQDLGILLANLYQGGARDDGDLNDDGFVDLSDLSDLLAGFGTECVF